MSELSAAGRVALDYCNSFPNTPTLTLAKELHTVEPELFPTIEYARSKIRYYRGEHGQDNRGSVERAGTIAPCTKYECQPSVAAPYVPHDLTVSGYGCIMADLHIPYHDRQAVEAAVEHAQKRGATSFLLILGDLLDCYQLSRFDRDPRNRPVDVELTAAELFLTEMTSIFDTVVYKSGNHEKRLQSYLYQHAPALAGIQSLTLPNLLHLRDNGVNYVSWDDPIYAGEHLTLIHGHEYGQSVFSPVNAARGLFLKALDCSITAHYHRTSHHDEPDIRGREISTWSIGCLCGLHPDYARLNKWNHGFALFETDGANDWNVANHRIVQGRVR